MPGDKNISVKTIQQAGSKQAAVKPNANARCFIDTNLLIYADSGDQPAKQRAALTLLKQLRINFTGVLSTQVLNEYCNVALNKLRLPHADIRQQLHFWRQFEVIQVTPSIIEAALDLHETRSLSYYDALVVAAAQTSGCTVLYSEDMNAGELIGGLRIVNPFVGGVEVT